MMALPLVYDQIEWNLNEQNSIEIFRENNLPEIFINFSTVPTELLLRQ